MLKPANATLRPWRCASSKISWIRCSWLEKLLMMIREPAHLSMTSPILCWISNSPCLWVPADSQFVDSFRKAKKPSVFAISWIRSKSNFLPSTGFSSMRQSPLLKMLPTGVRTTTAAESGIEWFTRTNSTLNESQSWILSWFSWFISWYSGSYVLSVSANVRCSMPIVNFVLYTGAGIFEIKCRNEPIWSKCPCVKICARIRCLFSSSQVMSGVM